MKDYPKVIGFVPAYNAEIFIEKTLRALAGQCYPNFEIWICDDASTDKTADLCESFCARDPRFKLFKNEKNLGWWKNSMIYWNKASKQCKYCFYQPHDDLPEINFIQEQVELLEKHQQTVLVVPGMKNTYSNGKSNSIVLKDFCSGSSPSSRIITLINWESNWWTAFHGLTRSEVLEKIFPINYLRFGEKEFAMDLIWLIKLSSWGPFICSDKVLFEKKYSDKTLSASWKYSFVNRSAVYMAIIEEIIFLSIAPMEKVKILFAIIRKTLDSIKRKIILSK